MTVSVAIGIDVGTSGVRVMAADRSGAVRATAERPLRSSRSPDGSLHEQNPAEWWEALRAAAADVMRATGSVRVSALAVTSTSGSLVACGEDGVPLRPAILYDDNRAAPVAARLGLLNASHSLIKAAWLREAEPRVWERIRYLLHPADWLASKFTGAFGCSDFSNALKLGYSVETRTWGEAVRRVAIPDAILPRVAGPGERIGSVGAAAAGETCIPQGTPVVAGATDGIASLVASGAHLAGHANTTLGTTLVWKVLASARPKETRGIYCHLHPSGDWAPGAASNTGPGSISRGAASCMVEESDRLAAERLPVSLICYPLAGRGERFPFLCPAARAFTEGEPRDSAEFHAAQLQGIAFVERWGYEILEECGAPVGDVVFSAGSAARSAVLAQLRADVLGRAVARCAHSTAAFGAAILAASAIDYAGDVRAAIREMTAIAERVEPRPDYERRYGEIYLRFREACERRFGG